MKKVIAVMMVLFATAAMAMSISQLNKASKEDLMQIKGIGEKKAEAILKARKKGKFTSYDDLMERVPGIGEQTTANLKSGVKNGEASKKVAKKAKRKAAKKTETKRKEAKKTKRNVKKELESKKSKAKKAEKKLKKSKKEMKKTKSKAKKKAKKAA